MNAAIMQPYLYPYIGYFQLIKSVDLFIFQDDVQYLQRGWTNRNRIILNGKDVFFSLPVHKAPVHTQINEMYFADNIKKYKMMILGQIQYTYHKAPFFEEIYPLIKVSFLKDIPNLSTFAIEQIKPVCSYLDIDTSFLLSSNIEKDKKTLEKQERLIQVNQILNTKHYINPINGGTVLYEKEAFANAGIKLSFLQTRTIKYHQFSKEFIPNLSIIDVLMHNSKDEVKHLLLEYDLV